VAETFDSGPGCGANWKGATPGVCKALRGTRFSAPKGRAPRRFLFGSLK